MPELPEVETIRTDLQKLIVGKKIIKISSDSLKQVQPSLAIVEKAVLGTRIIKVARRAKLLQINYSFKIDGSFIVPFCRAES
jgi:formamidopyrimidine-DNA glycosylase